jgi:PAS domain S-box-containing protein
MIPAGRLQAVPTSPQPSATSRLGPAGSCDPPAGASVAMTETTDSEEPTSQGPARRTFEAVFEHANDAIFIVDVDNDSIVDCNPAATALVEYSKDELLSMPASDLHPHNLEQFMAFAETVFEEGQGWTDDITCYCKSGDIVPAEMSASVIELDGRPHLVNHIRETTDREQREWFEALIEHSSDLISVVKDDGTIRYHSPSIVDVLGYERTELRSASYLEFVHPDDRPTVDAMLGALRSSDGAITDRQEYRFRRADGSWAWLEAIGSHRPASPVSGSVINARDVSVRKESQQQTAVLHRMIRHNLRNRLNVIMGQTSSLTAADDDEARAVAKIDENATKLRDLADTAGLLGDIIETYRVTQVDHDLVALVESAMADLRASYPAVQVTASLPATQHVSAGPKLNVAIDQVIENAAEHNDAEEPTVEVTVTPPDDAGYVTIDVADNGPGIPAQERRVLLEGRETPLEHSNGLGLWLVNWIVDRSGGRIEFHERDSGGSRVRLQVPAA